jgi:hypothetical protein
MPTYLLGNVGDAGCWAGEEAAGKSVRISRGRYLRKVKWRLHNLIRVILSLDKEQDQTWIKENYEITLKYITAYV